MTINSNQYRQLNEFIKHEDKNVRIIMAPPRTGSTVLENIINSSPSQVLKIHEPFIDFGYRKNEEETGYKNILEEILEAKKQNIPSQNILIKEMTHWANKNKAYKNLFNLTRNPILFNIRDPYLSIESRIKVSLKSTIIKPRIKTQQILLDYVANACGTESWEKTEFKEKIIAQLVPLKNESLDVDNIYNNLEPDLHTQLLHYFAKSKGYGDWIDMLTQSIEKQDYNEFEYILMNDEKRFSLKDLGWEAINEQINYLQEINQGYMIIDSSDFRNDSEEYVNMICNIWDLKFNKGMLNWDPKTLKISRNQERPQDKLWYESVKESNGVKPPTELKAELKGFPKQIRDYITEIAEPTYKKLKQNMNTLKLFAVFDELKEIYAYKI